MAEYTNPGILTVAAGQNVPLTSAAVNSKPCIVHRDGAGIVTLRGLTNQCKARFRVGFGGNVAVPTGGTPGPISVAIAVDGEPLPSSVATVTPAAAEAFFNVAASEYVDVTKGCCAALSIRNVSGEAIDVRNANLISTRVC